MSKHLSRNLEETKWLLENLDADRIYWVCEVFEDISAKFQCIEFIDYLKSLQNKFPHIDMTVDIERAKTYL